MITHLLKWQSCVTEFGVLLFSNYIPEVGDTQKHFIFTLDKSIYWFHDMQKLKLCKLHIGLSTKYLQIPFEVTERKQMNLDECIERAKTTTF